MNNSYKPLVFILSLPRSGATLLSQVLASCTDIGYITNRMSGYWDNHLEGVCRDEAFRDPQFFSNFKSIYGNTEGLDEPSEWSWFWHKWLDVSEEAYNAGPKANVEGLIGAIKEIQDRTYVPLMINSVFAMANLRLLIDEGLPILAVYIERDPFWVVNSTVNARIRRHNNISQWFGHKPKDYPRISMIEPPVKQIVEQVKSMHKEIGEICKELPEDSCFEMGYDLLVRNPRSIVDYFASFMGWREHPVNIKRKNIRKLKPFFNHNDPRYINKEYADDIHTFCRLAGY